MLGMSTPQVHWEWLRSTATHGARRHIYLRAVPIPALPKMYGNTTTAIYEISYHTYAAVDLLYML